MLGGYKHIPFETILTWAQTSKSLYRFICNELKLADISPRLIYLSASNRNPQRGTCGAGYVFLLSCQTCVNCLTSYSGGLL